MKMDFEARKYQIALIDILGEEQLESWQPIACISKSDLVVRVRRYRSIEHGMYLLMNAHKWSS
jgi:hypothetical protein